MSIRIGTRGSALALAQTYYIQTRIARLQPGIDIKIKIIKTSGDLHQDISLSPIDGKGLFIKEIEEALLKDEIDLAVHSMKDMPMDLPAGLMIAAIPEREDPRDAFVCKEVDGWNTLPRGSIIGTSNPRCAAQLLHLRPHWAIKDLRGNLHTRWRKMEHGEYQGILLAVAGIKRLKLMSEFVHPLDSSEFIPAIGQGALGIEIKEDKIELAQLLSVLNIPLSSKAVDAERSFLKKLGGECHSCLGAYASYTDTQLIIIGFVGSPDGKQFIRDSHNCDAQSSPHEAGSALAEKLLAKGAQKLL